MATKTKKPKRGFEDRKIKAHAEAMVSRVVTGGLRVPPELEGFPSGLPFTVTDPPSGIGSEHGHGFPESDHRWGNRVCAIAEEALRRGYAISVLLPAEWVADATAVICQNVTEDVHARYYSHENRLVVWSAKPMDDPDTV
ncbi:MAG TPA: hypothetical protein VGB18_06975 [Candidatus Thermoplasmatota archaeon]|jgi:hypothetical protein